MLVVTYLVVRIDLWAVQCQTELYKIIKIKAYQLLKSGCALVLETLELVQIKINALDVVFFGMFPKVIFFVFFFD
jgi:hypothetical protein